MPVPPNVPIITETGVNIINEPGTDDIITEGTIVKPNPALIANLSNVNLLPVRRSLRKV